MIIKSKDKITSSTIIERAFNMCNQTMYHIINAMSNQLIYNVVAASYVLLLQ
jgi:hypothetical protein